MSADNRTLEQMVWHPVGQLLPAYDRLVLVSMLQAEINGGPRLRWVTVGRRESTNKDGERWVDEKYQQISGYHSIVAWMPLPETYRD